MTLSQMQVRLAYRLQYDLDNYAGESPASADTIAQLNYAQNLVARHVHHARAGVSLAITSGTFAYNLHASAFGQPMIEVWQVVDNTGASLKNWTDQPGLYSYQEMCKKYDGWQAGLVSGTIEAACQVGPEIYFYKKPNSSPTFKVDGRCLPVPLSAAGDICELHIDLHEAVVDIAAIYASSPSASDQQAIMRLQRFNKDAYQTLSDVRDENMRVNQLRRGLPPLEVARR